jgi:preprotein translocase subunit SecB
VEPATLVGAWLAHVRFEDNREFPSAEQGDVSYTVDSEVDVQDFHRDETNNETHAYMLLQASIAWYRDDDLLERESGPFVLALGVRGFFVWDSSIVSEEEARAWLTYNGRWILWPYLRTYMTSVTSISRLPPLTIYTLDVPESPDFESEEDVRVSGKGDKTSD